MFSRRFAGSLGAAAVATGTLAAVMPAQAALGHGMGLRAGLHGSRAYPRAGGTAEYGFGDHVGRDLDVRLSHVGRLARWNLVVYVHGTRAGTMTISRAGYGHMDRDRGVPFCSAGQAIRIRTKSGLLVASGSFQPHR